jgi:hypothetical protein
MSMSAVAAVVVVEEREEEERRRVRWRYVNGGRRIVSRFGERGGD